MARLSGEYLLNASNIMSNLSEFKLIDLAKWERQFYFEHYLNVVKCSYSICANVDITALYHHCKQQQIKIYPAMIYLIATAVNQIEEMRIAFNRSGQLGTWNSMSPCYTVFQPTSKTFTNLWTPYTENFAAFHQQYLQDVTTYGEVKKFIAQDHMPENTFPVSCIPWVDFTGFNLNIMDTQPYLTPIFTMGKFIRQEDKILIPVAAQLHHATCDGWQAGQFFDLIKSLAANLTPFSN